MKLAGSAADPLWYKDAIIYELHVKAFADGNDDGIGDFRGLIQKLDYLQSLGVTCLWLLPFFPSPLKDDGYDIADYSSVHPSYGTIEDFQEFLHAAHDRGLQVLIELVVNHTSDQHPWFQAARHAAPGSPERKFYVWSDNDELYKDARIIFTDTETSNWTWDPVAKAYFWHRFFSHQPDLNYDNPRVIEEVLSVMRFWLDMGVDGLRVDAIPYLVERDGTNCENLPETHAVMKLIRAEIDKHYEGRMILAEANQWPIDVRPYFGDGDECHMAFHFPLMPRIYMALRQEDRLPITDIMAQTPDIPENCQWGLFLRNHDELTLEMVSDEERDYMYLAYSADPRMRINIGIRRRLAPLLDNNRRRIELLNSLLFSFPGTPILYYGDEIGMGDNIYLGDRNGVRTPMQWSGDRNAGFSRAVPAKLYSPVVMDPVWGYEAVNVEAQQSDPSSLLSWMRNMIALRKLFGVFGRGSLRFLESGNRKVLAYIREYEGEVVLCVANLCRFAQPVRLDMADYEGMVPVEMLGYVEFPAITKQAYPLTLGPYGFLWLELHPVPAVVDSNAMAERTPVLQIESVEDWKGVLEGANQAEFEGAILKDYLPRQRWYGAKSSGVYSTRVLDWGSSPKGEAALALVDVTPESGIPQAYLMTLALQCGVGADAVRNAIPKAILTDVLTSAEDGVLYDGLQSDAVCELLLKMIGDGARWKTRDGVIEGRPSAIFNQLRGPEADVLQPRRSSAEQSNASVFFGDRLILKMFRRPAPGLNPDVEIGRFLTEVAYFDRIPQFAGSIEYKGPGADGMTIGMLQSLVENEGDGWKWTMEELDRYFESCALREYPEKQGRRTPLGFAATAGGVSELAKDHAGYYLDAAGVLGRRTAELHLALASGALASGALASGARASGALASGALAAGVAGSGEEDAAFAPEPVSTEYLEALRAAQTEQGNRALNALLRNLPNLPDRTMELGALLLSRRSAFLSGQGPRAGLAAGQRIRVHGDYHLGQVLRVKGDFYILDFEGEPAKSLAERRMKHSPLKDVAGMLRSFSYAAYGALIQYASRRAEDFARLEPWAHLWEQSVSVEFLTAYWKTVQGSSLLPSDRGAADELLQFFLLDKALYELMYELNNRPEWVQIPLTGILSLV